MDRITKDHRSWNMSRIRGKDTKPEIIVRKYMYAKGLRYRIHSKLPGKPDIVISKKRVAIFVNGCFWHAHENCPDFRWPKTRAEFWKAKLESNVARDLKNYALLEADGWHIEVVWECQLKNNLNSTLKSVLVACGLSASVNH